MAMVYIPEPLQSLSRGQKEVTLEATTVRQIIAQLEALYPGMEDALVEDGDLKPHIAVAVDGEVALRPTMRLTCAFDHRIADGAQVAEFLCELRQRIENPETALLDL